MTTQMSTANPRYAWQRCPYGADYYDTVQGVRVGAVRAALDVGYTAHVVVGVSPRGNLEYQLLGVKPLSYLEAKQLVETTVRLEK